MPVFPVAMLLLILATTVQRNKVSVALDLQLLLPLILLSTSGEVMVGSILGELHRYKDAFGSNTFTLGSGYAKLNGICLALVIVLAVQLVIRTGMSGGFRVNATVIAAFALAVLAIGSGLSNGTNQTLQETLALLMSIAAASAANPRAWVISGRNVWLLVTLSSATVWMLHPTIALSTCTRLNKCNWGGAVFWGALGNENALGLVVVLSAPFALLATERRLARSAVLIVSAVYVYLSSSRSALIALTVLLSVIAIKRFIRSPKLGDHVVAAISVGCVLLAALTPLIVRSADSFTFRGYLWQQARDLFSTSPVLGLGPLAWSNWMTQGGGWSSARYSAHNEFQDVLVSAGALGGAVLIAVLLRFGFAVKSANLVVAVTCATMITERPISFWKYDFMSWLGVGILGLAGTKHKELIPHQIGRLDNASTLESQAV